MTIYQDLTFGEFFKATLYYYMTGKLLRRAFLFILALTALNTILGLATTSNALSIMSLMSIVIPVTIMFLLVVIFAFVMCFSIYKSKPYLFRGVSYDFTHWGVIRNGEQTQFSKPWRDISKFKENKAFFILYIANTDFHIIQKRMLKNQEEINNFRALLMENIIH